MGYGPEIGNINRHGYIEAAHVPEIAMQIGLSFDDNYYSQSCRSWRHVKEVLGFDMSEEIGCFDSPRPLTEEDAQHWSALHQNLLNAGHTYDRWLWLVRFVELWVKWALEHCENPGIDFG